MWHLRSEVRDPPTVPSPPCRVAFEQVVSANVISNEIVAADAEVFCRSQAFGSQLRGALNSSTLRPRVAAYLPHQIEHFKRHNRPYGAIVPYGLHVQHTAAPRSAIATIRHSIRKNPSTPACRGRCDQRSLPRRNRGGDSVRSVETCGADIGEPQTY